MRLIQNKVDSGQPVSVADHSTSDALILFGSMLFGVTGGMLTNVFTVYDTGHLDNRFDKLEARINNIKPSNINIDIDHD
jgi:hypothetical protein